MPREQILARAADEHARVVELQNQGALEAIYFGPGRSFVLLIVRADSQAEAQSALDTLPMRPFLTFEWQELEDVDYP